MSDKLDIEAVKRAVEGRSMALLADKFTIRQNEELYKTMYPTGFKELDKVLGGGLPAGLHCIGAISSLGKSSFAMQIVENTAKAGMPCIVFSLEMKAIDLTAKAISRQTFLDSAENEHYARTNTELTSKKFNENVSDPEWDIIKGAAAKVAEYSKKITIVECGANPYTVDQIGLFVQNYIQVYKEKPLVVVDYLQILDAPDPLKSAGDKQVADYNLKRLKILSDYFELPIIIISSFNRENYDMDVNFKAFKDSGNIEYSCDTVLGLQLRGINETGFNAEKAKAEFPRQLELKVLKQRYGEIGKRISYVFYTKYNLFEEGDFIRTSVLDSPFDNKKARKSF